MKLNDDLFTKIEKKTKVDKDTIMSLAEKINKGNLNDKGTILEVINVLSKATGKEVTEEQKEKIINKIAKDEIPKNVDKMFK